MTSVLQELTGLRACNLTQLLRLMRSLPDDAIEFHAHPLRNDFAHWVRRALGDERLAALLAGVDAEQCATIQALRNQLIQTLLPKLRLLVTIDWRMSSTGLYSDYILPVASWYERDALWLMGMPVAPWAHLNRKATEPMGEARSEWELFVLLARKIEERARERGTVTYRDAAGKERRLDQLEDRITFGGLYNEEDEEGLARDAYLNALNKLAYWKSRKDDTPKIHYI